MPSHDVQLSKAFGDTRLQQVVRLVNLQRQHYEECGELGRYIARHAIFTMVMDCRIAGIERATIDSALSGKLPPPPEQEDLSSPC
jgi:hypothetical protein